MTARAGSPAVTVVVPVHRAEQDVADLVARLAALEPPEGGVQVVVVDDASPDATADAADAAARAVAGGPVSVEVVRRSERGGPTAARRTGLAASQGRFVWHADADDEWCPAVVARLYATAVDTGADIVACRARRVEANGRTWTTDGVDALVTLERGAVTDAVLVGTIRGYVWDKLVRRDLLEGHDDRLPLATHDDFVVVVEALARAERVTLVPDVLYTYRERRGSVSTAPSPSLFTDLDAAATLGRALLDPDGRVPDWRWDGFLAWFVLVPALTTPAHQAWDRSAAAAVRRHLGRRLTWRHIGAVARLRGPRWAVHAAAAKALGPAFGPVYRALGRGLGWSLTPRHPVGR